MQLELNMTDQRTIIVSIGEQMIEDGKAHCCRSCPVALGMKAKIRPDWVVNVSMCEDGAFARLFPANGIVIEQGERKPEGIVVDLPDKATRWIKRFDAWESLLKITDANTPKRPKPFGFKLTLPTEMLP